MKKFISGCCVGFCLTAEGMFSPSSSSPNENLTDTRSQNQVQLYTNPAVVLNVFDRDLEWSDDILKNNQCENGLTVIPEDILRYKYEESTPFQKMFMYNFNWAEYKKRSEKEKESRWKIAEVTNDLCRFVGIMESRHSALFSKDVFVSLFNFGFKSLEAPEKVHIFEEGEKTATKVYQDLDFAERYWFEAIWAVFRWAELKSVEKEGHFSFYMEKNEHRDYTTNELSNWEKNLFRSFKDSKVFIFAKNEVMNREAALVNPNLLSNMTRRIDQLTQAVCQVEIARRENEAQFKEATKQYNSDKLVLTKEVEKQKQSQKELQKQLEQKEIMFQQQLEDLQRKQAEEMQNQLEELKRKQDGEMKKALAESQESARKENEALRRRLEELEKLTKEQQSQQSSQKQDAQLLEENFSEKQENTRKSPQEKINEKPVETKIENPVSVLEDFDFEQSSGSEQGTFELIDFSYQGAISNDKANGLGEFKRGQITVKGFYKDNELDLSRGWIVYKNREKLTLGHPSQTNQLFDMNSISNCISVSNKESSCTWKTSKGSYIFLFNKIVFSNLEGQEQVIIDLN